MSCILKEETKLRKAAFHILPHFAEEIHDTVPYPIRLQVNATLTRGTIHACPAWTSNAHLDAAELHVQRWRRRVC